MGRLGRVFVSTPLQNTTPGAAFTRFPTASSPATTTASTGACAAATASLIQPIRLTGIFRAPRRSRHRIERERQGRHRSLSARPRRQSVADGKGSKAVTLHHEGLPGHYWFGAYYSPWQISQFGTDQKATNSYGFYWHADQMLWQEAAGGDQRPHLSATPSPSRRSKTSPSCPSR